MASQSVPLICLVGLHTYKFVMAVVNLTIPRCYLINFCFALLSIDRYILHSNSVISSAGDILTANNDIHFVLICSRGSLQFNKQPSFSSERYTCIYLSPSPGYSTSLSSRLVRPPRRRVTASSWSRSARTVARSTSSPPPRPSPPRPPPRPPSRPRPGPSLGSSAPYTPRVQPSGGSPRSRSFSSSSVL